MGRNFHNPKDYEWKGDKAGEMLVCVDAGDTLFAVFNDGLCEVALNAYMAGKMRGEEVGEENAKREIRRSLGINEQGAAGEVDR